MHEHYEINVEIPSGQSTLTQTQQNGKVHYVDHFQWYLTLSWQMKMSEVR